MNRILTHIPPREEAVKKSDAPMAQTMRPRLLTTHEAADYLRLSARTLERYRVDGTGPAYSKAGPGLRAKVLYRIEDLEVWLQGFQYSSTSEYVKKK